MISRMLQPKILQTKEELLIALKSGQLKTSKYNLLKPNEKIFVELIVFGGYTGEQAIRVIDPSVKNPLAIANRMASQPNVVATLEELSVAKDKKFMAEISSARDMALEKLKYIMSTTNDDSLAASCAKVILDKSEAIMKNQGNKEEPVGQVRFNIQVENVYTGSATPHSSEPVIIPIDADYEDAVIVEKKEIEKRLDAEIQAKNERLKQLNKNTKTLPINPETGLAYTIAYEGIDNYSEPEDELEVIDGRENISEEVDEEDDDEWS